MTDTITPPVPERKPLRQVVLKLLLTTAYFWIPMMLFLWLADKIHDQEPLFGDVAILQAIHSIANPLLDSIAVAVTHLGSAPTVVAGVLLASGLLAYKHRKRQALFLLFCAGGTAAINVIFKLIFQRERPSLWTHIVTENSYSFPSGHAMISSALALSVIILCWHTRFRWIALVASCLYFLLVSGSRLYLGVHFPSDVIGGWCVSVFWVLTVHHIFARFGRKQPTTEHSMQKSGGISK